MKRVCELDSKLKQRKAIEIYFLLGKTLMQTVYLVDLAPSDFWLYPRLKKNLHGKRFDNLNFLKQAVRNEIANISSQEFHDCQHKQWPKRKA